MKEDIKKEVEKRTQLLKVFFNVGEEQIRRHLTEIAEMARTRERVECQKQNAIYQRYLEFKFKNKL